MIPRALMALTACVALWLGSACAAQPAAPTAAQPGVTQPQPVQPSAAPAPTVERELILYSARKEELMRPVVEGFEKQTGMKVTIKSGAPGELALLIEQEKASPRGDVYFTTDAATIEQLGRKGLLEPYKSLAAARVPAEFQAANNTWTGVIGRARTIMYNTSLVKPEEAPTSVFQLTEPKWKGKVAMASIREGGVQLWLASLMLLKGEDFTVGYIKALKDNGLKVLANHTEVYKAVGRGEVPIGLVNHYYYVFAKREGLPVGQVYPDQGPNDLGTLVMPLAVGIIKGARHPQAARAFVDYVLSPAGQEPLTKQENEFPLVAGVGLGAAAVPGVKPIDEIKRPQLDVVKLAEIQTRMRELFTPLLGGS